MSFIKITLAILLAGFVLIGGCVAIIGAGASSAVEEIEKEQDAHAITKSQLASVHMGDSKAQVKAVLGEPDNEQHMEHDGSDYGGGVSTNDCLYYNVKGGEFLDSYQLCFDNGKLRSKNHY